ncbi:MAG: hypothetical protein EOO61_21315, partial [Hymenobacter sp.]
MSTENFHHSDPYSSSSTVTGHFYSEQPVALDSNGLAFFRALLTQWATRIPHHPYGRLGEEADLLSVRHVPCHLVLVSVQQERRGSKAYREPYRRQVT